MNKKEIKEVLINMHKYLYNVYMEECSCNEGNLDWEEIEKFYKKLYNLGLLRLDEKEL